jgi:speckle-type POZ protein
LLEKKGKIGLTKYGLLEHTFSPPTYDFGYPKFFEKSRLRSSPEFKTGCFIIRCVLTVTKEPRTEEIKRNLTVVPQPNLQDHLQQMLKDGQGADVTFSVSGRLLNVHRYLLAARSPVFKAELFGPMKEKETNTIPIQDIEPSVFEALLHFVYTDSLQDDEHNKGNRVAKLQHLLVAADRYGLNRLRLLCESKLCVDIDMDTVAASLALAEQHHCKDLKEACIQFMAPRNVLQAVMATNGFKHLVESCPFVIIELLDMLCRNG